MNGIASLQQWWLPRRSRVATSAPQIVLPWRRTAPAAAAHPRLGAAGGWFLAGAAGAALMFFLDPDRGARRRHIARDRVAAAARREVGRVRRLQRRAASDAYGLSRKIAHLVPADAPPPNDATLVQKVESVLFRDPAVPKGRININAEDGTIVLRGELARPDQIDALVMAVRRVPGVRAVKSLLHLPQMPPPHKQEALEVH